MSALAPALLDATGATLREATAVGGGSISHTLCAHTRDGPVFVKHAPAQHAAILVAEIDGLTALARCPAVRVPRVLGQSFGERDAWLFLEWIELRSLARQDHQRLGEAVADLHSVTGLRFGWERDNFIGSTPQCNTFDENWPRFFARNRLAPQLDLAQQNGHDGALLDVGQRVLADVAGLLGADQVTPSLVHGDLWSGNRAIDESGRPVLYDPAVHFADPHTDIAMTRLFGGFDASFYSAHEARHGRASRSRIALYQLYHVLNHLNLFGRAYADQAMTLMRTLL